jgi:hypothetical protein
MSQCIDGAALLTENEKLAVRRQLGRLLNHPVFKNSSRCHNFLQYVVEHSIQQNHERLKERTIGIEVFGRGTDYDTGQDSVVRTTAIDVRKRIAQYYHEPGHEDEIMIDLPPGSSYVPEFRFPATLPPESEFVRPSLESRVPVHVPPEDRFPSRKRWIPFLATVTALVLLMASITFWRLGYSGNRHKTLVTASGTLVPMGNTVTRFWQPILAQTAPILICIKDPDSVTGGPGKVLEDTSLADEIATARLTGFIGGQGRAFELKSASSTSWEDLRRGPEIIVGGFDNSQALREADMNTMRFRLVRDPKSNILGVEDRKNPSQQDWYLNMAVPASQRTEEYGIIARFLDPNSGQWTVLVAGLGKNAISAAVELLLDPKDIEQLRKQAPADWTSKNIEAVISTLIGNGYHGPAKVQAVEVW